MATTYWPGRGPFHPGVGRLSGQGAKEPRPLCFFRLVLLGRLVFLDVR
jgi:hypothetical protein